MADTAIAKMTDYNDIIHHQQERIKELETDIARYSDKIRLLKTRATESHHAAVAVAAASDYARFHAAHIHAMLAMSAAAGSNASLPSLSPLSMTPVSATPVVTPSVDVPSVSNNVTTPAPTPTVATATPVPPKRVPPNSSRASPSALSATTSVRMSACSAQRSSTVGTTASSAGASNSAGSGNDEDERAGKTRYWTEMEHNQFLYAVKLFGPKNYVAISQFVGSRTPKQVRTHAQKYQMKLQREAKKRRAQAAAVAAVTAPGSAAAAAAATAAAAMAVGVDGNSLALTSLGLPGVPFAMPVSLPGAAGAHQAVQFSLAMGAPTGIAKLPVPGSTDLTPVAEIGTGPKSDSGAKTELPVQVPEQAVEAVVPKTEAGMEVVIDDEDAEMGDTMDDDGIGDTNEETEVETDVDPEASASIDSYVGTDAGEGCTDIGFNEDDDCSPVCNDRDDKLCSEIGDAMVDLDVDVDMDVGVDVDVDDENGNSLVDDECDDDLKKSVSLANLADYDDFMRRIAAVVQDQRGSADLFEGGAHDLDMDLLNDDSKKEQFGDSLLVDL